MIPWNESVKILCWGTPESYLYQLEILRNLTFEVVEKKLGFQEKAEFLISHMNTNTAGRYQCQYRKEYKLSEHSKTLELVVTGEDTSSVSSPWVLFLSYSFKGFTFRTVWVYRKVEKIRQRHSHRAVTHSPLLLTSSISTDFSSY